MKNKKIFLISLISLSIILITIPSSINLSACVEPPEEPVCEHDVAVRYTYGNSFGTGIAIKENCCDWISEIPAVLTKENEYKIKYIIDNKIENTTNNINVKVKLDDNLLYDYNTSIKVYHYKELNLDISSLECNSLHTIYLEVEKINEIDCNLTDNYASREIFIFCEEDDENGDEEEFVCGNGILEPGEECDWGLLNGFLCWAGYGKSCFYCSSTCELKTLFGGYCGDGKLDPCEECDLGELNGVPSSGCTIDCKLEDGDGDDDGDDCDDDDGDDCDDDDGDDCDDDNGDDNGDDDNGRGSGSTNAIPNLLECENWGACVNGIQKRICKEIYGYTYYFEITETRVCVSDFVPLAYTTDYAQYFEEVGGAQILQTEFASSVSKNKFSISSIISSGWIVFITFGLIALLALLILISLLVKK